MNILDDHLFCYTYRFVTIKLFLYDTYQTLSKERRDKVTKVTEVRLQKTENWMRKCIDSSVQRAWQGNGNEIGEAMSKRQPMLVRKYI